MNLKANQDWMAGLSIPDHSIADKGVTIGAVVLYSTNDYDYFNLCINNLLDCGISSIVVVTCSRMWNGDEENQELMEQSIKLYADNPKVEFIKIPWVPDMKPFYFENIGREMGVSFIQNKCDFVLLIDTDEIIDPYTFSIWLNTYDISRYKAIGLKQYFYMKSAIYRAKTCDDYNVVLFNTKYANKKRYGNARRRFLNYDNKISRWLTKLGVHPKYKLQKDDLIFIHHYSWVKTKEQLLKKVNNWGHREDRKDWASVVNNIIDKNEFEGEYIIVNNIFNIKTNL